MGGFCIPYLCTSFVFYFAPVGLQMIPSESQSSCRNPRVLPGGSWRLDEGKQMKLNPGKTEILGSEIGCAGIAWFWTLSVL